MKFKKRCIMAAMGIILCFQPVAASAMPWENIQKSQAADSMEKENSSLRLWYNEPAPISSSDGRWWQSEVLPIGNSKIGGMVFGEIAKDRIHINEKTLWTGGPKNGEDKSSDGNPYRGGNRLAYAGDELLENYRQQLDDKSENVFGLPFNEANNILTQNFFSGRSNKGTYMDFGDIYMDFARSGIDKAAVSGYVRDLDLERAVSTIQFSYDGETYRREMFVSYPDNVLVCRLSCTGKKMHTLDVSLAGTMTGSKDISVSGNKIILSGSLIDNGMKYEAQLAVLQEGGSLQAGNDKIAVDGADEVTLILSAATNYANKYPTYRGEDPSPKVTKAVDAAVEKGYSALLKDHLADYQELFSRVNLDLRAETPKIPTDELVENYRNGKTDPALEVLIYQYGRYLTIAGSREGSLPTNLCGMWLLGNADELWQGDYHYNVNLQMNYWPAYSTNLAECGTPLNEFAGSLVVPGRYAAAMGFGGTVDENAPIGEGNGFLVHTAGNPFGGTAPHGIQEYGWNPNGGTWLLQNVYDYFRFTQDKEVLRDTIYPMLKEAANFWAEHLWYSSNQNRLAVAPSVSAEQGPTAIGTTYDQSLVWQLFEESIQAAQILETDEEDIAIWKEKQNALKPIMISEAGYIKEWYEETTPGKAQDGNLAEINIPNFNAGYTYETHRHSSHLIGLYPGSLINKDNKAYIEAARKCLLQRDFAGTGWSKAHRINLWARAMDGNNAYRLVKGMLQGGNAGILTNLLDSHGNGNGNHTDYPVFQIDGNYGITAGMTEMLLQSHLGYTQILPALPDAWASGSVNGLVARGNFVIDMEWKEKEAVSLSVLSRSGGTFTAEYRGLSDADVLTSQGKAVATTKITEDKVSFETKAGETYIFRMEAPRFNVREGKVSAGTEIEIISPDSSYEIRYTLDGSEPNQYAKLYKNPLVIQGGDVLCIKAALFLQGKRVGRTAHAEYQCNLSLEADRSEESSSWGDREEFTAQAARDGKKAPETSALGNGAMDSRWAPKDNETENWMIFDFGRAVTVNTMTIEQYKDTAGKNHIDAFRILYSNDKNIWEEAYDSNEAASKPEWILRFEGNGGKSYETKIDFPEVTGRYMKFLVTEGENPSVWEWEIYHKPILPETDKSALQKEILSAQSIYDQEVGKKLTQDQQKHLEELLQCANEIFYDGFAVQEDINETQQFLKKLVNTLQEEWAKDTPPKTIVLDKPVIKSVQSKLTSRGTKVIITVNTVKYADGYVVYRKTGNGVQSLGQTDASQAAYDTEPPLNGKTVSYYAKAISKNALYQDSAEGTAKTLNLPKAPKKGIAARSGSCVNISWSKVKKAKAYIVFRMVSPKSGYKKIAIVKNKTTYTDKKGTKKNCRYAVAVKGSGKKYSGMRKLKTKK